MAVISHWYSAVTVSLFFYMVPFVVGCTKQCILLFGRIRIICDIIWPNANSIYSIVDASSNTLHNVSVSSQCDEEFPNRTFGKF